MLRKILLLNFNKEQKQKFESHLLSLGENYQLRSISSVKELDTTKFKTQCIFYVVSSESQSIEQEVEEIKSELRGIPINFIFETKDFTGLLKVFEFSPRAETKIPRFVPRPNEFSPQDFESAALHPRC